MSLDPKNKAALEAVGIIFLIIFGLIAAVGVAIFVFRWAAGG